MLVQLLLYIIGAQLTWFALTVYDMEHDITGECSTVYGAALMLITAALMWPALLLALLLRFIFSKAYGPINGGGK